MQLRGPFVVTSLIAASVSCAPPPEPPPKVTKGGACDYGADASQEGAKLCADGYTCEPVSGQQGYVCATPIVIRGMVIDALSEAPLAGAQVIALDRTSAPVSDVAVSDAAGMYELEVSALRDADGELADEAKYTLNSFAADYAPFPAGVRPALPVSTTQSMIEQVECGDQDGDGDVDRCDRVIIENPTTVVALIPLPAGERGGATITGSITGAPAAGTLVVAEGVGTPAPYGLADSSGAYTIFNVPPGSVSVHGYRSGLEIPAASVTTAAGMTHTVDLAVSATGDALATVDGSVNIVNAPGGSKTSVVLVPSAVFNTLLERGPVPYGLRAPGPGLAPDVTGSYAIPGVPAGKYMVLAAFENDELVRDPDTSIAGTEIPEIEVIAGQALTVPLSFKITEALDVVGPGREAPEAAASPLVFEFADDSSEDRYEVVVFDALGSLVWEDKAVPGVSGSSTVKVPYGGPALISGMWYQFRATSWRDKGGGTAISRTEDLRGVFYQP